ncbi:MAG TPA: VanZ family protein [Gammaproteobacteria bacterium]
MPATGSAFARGAWALIGLTGGLLLIVILSDLNGGRIQDLSLAHPGIDKLAHFGLHLVLVGVLYAILRRYWEHRGAGFALLIAAGASVLAGFADEGHQFFVGGRDFDLFDIAANLCGTATAAALLIFSMKRSLYRLSLTAVPLALFTVVLMHAHAQLQYFNAGLLQARAGEYAAARQSLLTALAKGHTSPGLYNELAWIELEFLPVDPAPALRYTEQALAYEADNPDYLDTHGWALYRNRRYQEALAVLLKAYAGNPDIYCIHYHLGATYHALGRDAEAIEHLTKQLASSTDARFSEKARTLLATLRNKKDSTG